MPTETKYRSRFSTDDRGLSVPAHRLTELRLNVLKSLTLDRFKSADYLALETGTSYLYMIDVCTALKSKPYAYIKICDEQADHPVQHLHTKLQFELTELGAQVVLDKFGIVVPPRKSRVQHIAHHIMGDHAMASFRIGVKESGGRFAMLTRDELLAHPNTPELTRNSDTPDFIPLGDKVESEKGKMVDHYIRPDREMFVIRDLRPDRKRAYFFPGLEVGRGTERIKGNRHDHSYMDSKFEDYIRIIERQIYKSHFGAPNCYNIFLEPSIHRFTTKMLPMFADMTRKCPEIRKYFLFKVHHEFTEKYTASGFMLTEPYIVVGDDDRTTEFSMV